MVRFFVFSDLHYDEMTDGGGRIDELLSRIKESRPDFCVSLGDCCNPLDKNRTVLSKLETTGVPVYYVVGNHETDCCHLENVLKFYALDKPYYSFEYDDYKFIVLNTCYCSKYGIEYSYYNKNYKEENTLFPIIPVEEMKWLKKELENEEKKYIIFSHHSLANNFRDRGVFNRDSVRNLFHNKKVILCMNGHDHGDDLSIIDNVPFYTVNSASYVWAGWQIMNSKVLTQKYGHLNGILPYKQTLCVLVEMNETELRLKGIDGEYLSVTPDDIGLYNYVWNGVSIKPRTSSYHIKY